MNGLKAVILLGILLLGAAPASSHGIQHDVRIGEAIVLEMRYADGTPLAHGSCEISRVGEDQPLLQTRTDARGRVAFVPDFEGRFRCRVFSEDGHGTQFEFDGSVSALSEPVPRESRLPGALIGLGLLGVIALGLYVSGRRSAASTPSIS